MTVPCHRVQQRVRSGMVRQLSGAHAAMTHTGRTPMRIAAIAALAAALALAGCGRKGPLEPPPSSQTAAPTGTSAPQGTSKRVPIDVLLD